MAGMMHLPVLGQRCAKIRLVNAETSTRVRLLSKPGCHLCDEAREIIATVCDDLGETYDEIDISRDAAMLARYGEQIPVTFVDGRQHDFWRVDAERLRRALRGA